MLEIPAVSLQFRMQGCKTIHLVFFKQPSNIHLRNVAERLQTVAKCGMCGSAQPKIKRRARPMRTVDRPHLARAPSRPNHRRQRRPSPSDAA